MNKVNQEDKCSVDINLCNIMVIVTAACLSISVVFDHFQKCCNISWW